MHIEMDGRPPRFHPASSRLLEMVERAQSQSGPSANRPVSSIANPHSSGARQSQAQQPAPPPQNPPPLEQVQHQQPRRGGPPAWLEALPPLPGLNDRIRNMEPWYDASLARPGPNDPYRRRFNPLPALVTPSALGPSDRNCPICKIRYGEVDPPDTSEFEYPVKLQCGHVYGHQCIEEWLQTSLLCPLCKVAQDFDLGPERGESAREAASREEWRRAEAEIQMKRRTRRSSEGANARGRPRELARRSEDVSGRTRELARRSEGARVRPREPARRSEGTGELEQQLEEMQLEEYAAAGFDQRDTAGDERLALRLQRDQFENFTAGDEALAQTLQEHVNTTGDERMAQTLQDHVDTTGDERMAQRLQAEWGQRDAAPVDSEAVARRLEEEQLREYGEELNRLALEEWQKKEFQKDWK